jgi:hypothetical protein
MTKPVDYVIKIIDQIIPQVRIWNDQIMCMKMSGNKISTCCQVKMMLISCKDHDHPRIVGNIRDSDKEMFSIFYISSQLKECDFPKYIKIVLDKIPNQQEQADKMTELFSKLSPLLK